eukprot:SM005747S18612  [mRNA]  locus=s5747:105:921:+ [translate_table: standard]
MAVLALEPRRCSLWLTPPRPRQAGLEGGCDKAVGNLVYTAATKFPPTALGHRPVLMRLIAAGKVWPTAPTAATLSPPPQGRQPMVMMRKPCSWLPTQIRSVLQVDEALAYLAELGSDALDEAELERRAGVGIEVTPEQIHAAVAEVIAAERSQILELRYR